MSEHRIGCMTLHVGRNGRYVGWAGPAPSDTFERMLRGKATTEEYVSEVRQRGRDMARAHSMLGKRAESGSGAQGEAP